MVRFSKDGKLLASAAMEEELLIYNVEKREI